MQFLQGCAEREKKMLRTVSLTVHEWRRKCAKCFEIIRKVRVVQCEDGIHLRIREEASHRVLGLEGIAFFRRLGWEHVLDVVVPRASDWTKANDDLPIMG